MRLLLTTLCVGLSLSACATRPQMAHGGHLVLRTGEVVATDEGAAATGLDATLAKSIQARIFDKVNKRHVGQPQPGAMTARYRLEVTVATSPSGVGISSADGARTDAAPWRSAPVKLRPWSRRGPLRTVTLSVLDLSSGKAAAWATVRTSGSNPDDLAERLLEALAPPQT